jgi:hypothetical protein
MEAARVEGRIWRAQPENDSIVPAIVTSVVGVLGMVMVAVAPWLLLV